MKNNIKKMYLALLCRGHVVPRWFENELQTLRILHQHLLKPQTVLCFCCFLHTNILLTAGLWGGTCETRSVFTATGLNHLDEVFTA